MRKGQNPPEISGQRYASSQEDVLGNADASALREQLIRGEVSSAELMQAAVARVRAADSRLDTLSCERFDDAIREARVQPAANEADPGFGGMPSAIKDNTDIVGLPTLHGSRAIVPRPAKRNAPFADQFLSTGLIPLGKTRLPEFGLTASTEFVEDPPVRNHWNMAYSAGGSSGGSAALVACGALPIAHANDGGGSIRIPAACCGLVGMKVSRGRVVVNDQSKNLPIDLIGDGVVSRSVRDTARFLAAAERHFRGKSMPALGLISGPLKPRLRIGCISYLPDGMAAHADCIRAVDDTAALCETLGHRVQFIDNPLDPRMADHFMLYYGLLAAGLRWGGKLMHGWDFDASKLDPLTHQLSNHLRANLLRLPAAMASFRRAAKSFDRLYQQYDALLSPTLGHPPPKLGHLSPDLDFDTAWTRLRQFAGFTPISNCLGTPAISLPLARSSKDLPIGLQFAAPAGEEARLLGLALELEEADPWPQSTAAEVGT